MRILTILALSTVASASASAQSFERAGPGYAASVGEMHVRSRLPADEGVSRECLVRKSDGKRICHTREQWRVIATQMPASGAQAQ